MNGELLSALERIEREKGVSKEVLFSAIESALASAARKIIDDPDVSKEDITVVINKETGEIQVFSEGEEIQSERFGRIAAQTAKQVIIQKIREAERDVVFAKYLNKIGSIISGSVHRFEKGDIVVELEDAEAILPKKEQIPTERFRQGENIRAYLLKVEKSSGGPEIILSRSDAGFVKKLFELEVPEITQGIVEIKAVAREAGERTKVAVCSKDEKIDPVGACVGMRGSRVRDIVKELHGERIDIVRWDNDIRVYLPAAVSPAEVTRMVIDRENKSIRLTVARDQLSLLIGKKGRNIRLASKLLGWELAAEPSEDLTEVPLAEVKVISKRALELLQGAGYDNTRKVIEAGIEKLMELDGVGEKTAQKIIDACKKANSAASENKAADKEESKTQPEPKEGAPNVFTDQIAQAENPVPEGPQEEPQGEAVIEEEKKEEKSEEESS